MRSACSSGLSKTAPQRFTPAITDRDLAKIASGSRSLQPMGGAESEWTFFSPELRRLRDVHFLLSTAPTEDRALVRSQEEMSRFTNRVIELKHEDSENRASADAMKFLLAKCELLRYFATMPATRRRASMKPEDLETYYKERASFRSEDRILGAFLEHLRSPAGQVAFGARRLLWITQARWFLVETARTASNGKLQPLPGSPAVTQRLQLMTSFCGWRAVCRPKLKKTMRRWHRRLLFSAL